jgi:hypothetical protein
MSGYRGEITTAITAASLDTSCVLRLESRTTSRLLRPSAFKPTVITSVESVPLREVDLQGVYPTDPEDKTRESFVASRVHAVRISIVGDRPLIEYSSQTDGKHEQMALPQAVVSTSDGKGAERIANALRRAVELCGGKREVF